jgi:initiation factor 1A
MKYGRKMPKNTTGGKNFKKGRKVPTDAGADEKRFDGLEEGQDLGRVTKMLGNRRVLCFCGSDGMERVCKIRGVLCKGPKKQRIEIGDIVLLSARDFSGGGDDSDDDTGVTVGAPKAAEGGAVLASGKRDVYDIMGKLAPSQVRDARRKVTGMHKHLFEVTGGYRTEATTAAWEFGVESDEEDGAGAGGSGNEISHVVDKRNKVKHRQAPAAPLKTEASSGDEDGSDSDVDVDNI